LSGKKLVELTKAKLLELGERTFRIHDKARHGYYEGKPISKTQLAVILEEVGLTMEDLKARNIDLKTMEKLEDRIIARSLGWSLEDVQKIFPIDMKAPVATCILLNSNLLLDQKEVEKFFLE